MKIEINIPEMMCRDILSKNDYVAEKVTLYYDENADYEYIMPGPRSLRGVERKVAYPRGRKPECLTTEYPMMDECKDFEYDRVVNDLFCSWLYEVMYMYYKR